MISTSCMNKMWNLVISFPGNFAFGGKYLQFRGEIYHLYRYFGLFLPKICKKITFLTQFVTIFQEILHCLQPWISLSYQSWKLDNAMPEGVGWLVEWKRSEIKKQLQGQIVILLEFHCFVIDIWWIK